MPIYALCVAFLFLLKPLLGWSYVDASVYVCEYFQPVFTAVVALLFLILCIRKVISAFQSQNNMRGLSLLAICLSYLAIGVECIRELLSRLSEYAGMSNHQVFDYVVHKLSVMGSGYPEGRFNILNFETVSYGYIMANMEVYILPISIVILLYIIQRTVSRKISR